MRERKAISELMGHYGFAFVRTGGNCTMYERRANGISMQVTESYEPVAPTAELDQPIMVGIYTGPDYDVDVMTLEFDSVQAFLSSIC